MINLTDILSKFDIVSRTEKYGNGHINDTFLTKPDDYIIQRINTNIFKKPDELMQNIDNVTTFLRKKIADEYGDPDRETLTVMKTKEGKLCYKYDDDNVFRVYKFISGTKTIETDKTVKDMYHAGKGFGKFQMMLDDYPVDTLFETIKDFHNTPKRVLALKEAIKEDKAGRAASVQEEIEFALENATYADTVIREMENGNIPIRVTHNDTKINNILFDEMTGEAVAVIDLDTVMPGSMLYDFGDALRLGASTAAEDETNLDKVHFDVECFKSFAKGYLSEMRKVLTPTELDLLPFSAKLLTYECGIRFLTDYLNGDTYFKIHHEYHNLDRARNQFKLVREIAQLEDELKEIINNL